MVVYVASTSHSFRSSTANLQFFDSCVNRTCFFISLSHSRLTLSLVFSPGCLFFLKSIKDYWNATCLGNLSICLYKWIDTGVWYHQRLELHVAQRSSLTTSQAIIKLKLPIKKKKMEEMWYNDLNIPRTLRCSPVQMAKLSCLIAICSIFTCVGPVPIHLSPQSCYLTYNLLARRDITFKVHWNHCSHLVFC